MRSELARLSRTACVALLVFTVLTGLIYPMLVYGVGQAAFPNASNGSLVRDDRGTVVGSTLIGQAFTHPGYFWSRRSHAEYNASNSTGANAGPSDGKGKPNPKLVDPTKARIAQLREADPDNGALVPVDLVTASGSGLDPHISPDAARYQASRVARVRHLPISVVEALIDEHTEPRTLGILGEPRVNVLLLNRGLDARKPLTR
jgi:potassium-transporting ATPase KdpC subunit